MAYLRSNGEITGICRTQVAVMHLKRQVHLTSPPCTCVDASRSPQESADKAVSNPARNDIIRICLLFRALPILRVQCSANSPTMHPSQVGQHTARGVEPTEKAGNCQVLRMIYLYWPQSTIWRGSWQLRSPLCTEQRSYGGYMRSVDSTKCDHCVLMQCLQCSQHPIHLFFSPVQLRSAAK
jgi:hypothetical protein